MLTHAGVCLRTQVNRKSIDMGNERSEVLRKQLQVLSLLALLVQKYKY